MLVPRPWRAVYFPEDDGHYTAPPVSVPAQDLTTMLTTQLTTETTIAARNAPTKPPT
jgi:hypothetical protein